MTAKYPTVSAVNPNSLSSWERFVLSIVISCFSQKTNGRVVIMLASRDSSSGLAELLALSLLASEGHPRLDPYIEKQILRFSTKYTVV